MTTQDRFCQLLSINADEIAILESIPISVFFCHKILVFWDLKKGKTYKDVVKFKKKHSQIISGVPWKIQIAIPYFQYVHRHVVIENLYLENWIAKYCFTFFTSFTREKTLQLDYPVHFFGLK